MRANERLATAFVAAHPADAARLLERGDPADAAAVLTHVPADDAAGVFRTLAPSFAAACAALLSDEQLAAIVSSLSLSDGTQAMRRVEPGRRDTVLAGVPEDRREQLHRALRFADGSAGSIADPLVLSLPEDITVADAQKQLRGAANLYYYVYVVARDGTLAGTLAINELMTARPKQVLASVMRRDLIRLDAYTDLATVAMHPAWRDLDALPVVDSSGKLVGAIRHRIIRQLASQGGRPMMETLVRLSELYWAGLSGILASLTEGRERGRTVDNTGGAHVS